MPAATTTAARSSRPRPEVARGGQAMTAGPRIAIDAMGGDVGPAAIVAGIARARRKDRALRFHLYGEQSLIGPELERHKGVADAITVHHATDAILAGEKPSQAIRRAR